MNIHTLSVVKSGGIAAALSLVIALLSAIPPLRCIVWPLQCLGWFLIPIGAGLGYGYLAPGRENLAQSALGGALAGGFGGFVFGLIRGIVSVAVGIGMLALDDPSGGAVLAANQPFWILLRLGGSLISGLAFGAIGGVIWPLVQERQK